MQEDKDPLENSPDLQKNIPSKGMGLSAMINSTTLKNSYSTIFSLKILLNSKLFLLTIEMQNGQINSPNINHNRLKSESLYPSRFNKFSNQRNYINTDFILVKNNSKMNRIWEYPEDKDKVPLSPHLWKMEKTLTEEDESSLDINLNGNIENSDLLTHKSKLTDFSKKDSEKSGAKNVTDKEKAFSKINEKQVKAFDISNSDGEAIPRISLSKWLIPEKRELIKKGLLKPFPGKKFGFYNLVLNVDELNLKKDERINFYVRIFANKGEDIIK